MNRTLKKLIKRKYSTLSNEKITMGDLYTEMFSDKELIIAETNDGYRIKSFTYGEIKNRIELCANAIYEKIGSGNFVGIEMENCVEWIVTFWAVLKSGNKPYLINMRHPLALSQNVVETLNIKNVICIKKGSLDTDYIEFDSIGQSENEINTEFADEFAIASSATSLTVKICIYNGRSMAKQLLNARHILMENKRMPAHYKGRLKQLAFLPFYHIFGLTAVYMWFAFFGRTIVFLKDYSATTILQTCRKHEVTHIFAVPLLWHTIEKQIMREVSSKSEKKQKTFYRGIDLCTKIQNIMPMHGNRIAMRIMHEITDKLFGRSVKFCISGGSRLNDSALKLFNGIGYPLHNGYGMSEIGITSVELRYKPKDRNKGSVGKPFESITYTLDKSGVLTVEGNSLACRIIENGVETSLDSKLCTGDIFKKDDDGYYYITGRESDIVIGENGENINPDDIEKLFKIEKVSALSILGLMENNEEKLSMVVQISPYLPDAAISTIKDEIYKINNTLPYTQQIRSFYFTTCPIAPETAIKIGRQYLNREIESGNIKLISFSEIKNTGKSAEFDENSPLAIKVKEIVGKVIGIDPKNLDCYAHVMFDLGASSIQYFTMLGDMAKEFGINGYNENDNLTYTIREFCEYIERYL